MAPRRLSRRQRHILQCLMTEYRRTQGVTLMGQDELGQALGRDKSHSSHSLRTLETRGVLLIHRTPGGQAYAVNLTAEGRKGVLKWNEVVIKKKEKHKQVDREPRWSLISPAKEPLRVRPGGV
jgi:DNA-binding MarR family transcriptional regulator